MCICPLTKPGVTTISRASIVRSAGSAASSAALPTRSIRFPRISTEPSRIMRRSASIVMMKRAPSTFVVAACSATIASRALRRHGAREPRQHLVHATVELALLVPRGEAEQDIGRARLDELLQLRGALLRRAARHPALHRLAAEDLRRVVAVQVALGLVDRRLAVLVDVEVVVERAG